MSSPKHRNVERRELSFAERPVTKIWQENPSELNPYLADSCRCYGYDFFELLEKRSLVDIQFLLFRGDLPTPEQAELLSKLQIAMIHPGPRHPAVRAAMCAGVGKTDPANILPLALTVLGGNHQGATEVKECLKFLTGALRQPAALTVEEIISTGKGQDRACAKIPGFGNRFGGIEPFVEKLAEKIVSLPGAGKHLRWGQEFADALQAHNMGWQKTGIAAAALADLGFSPLEAVGIYQMICSPGILAHGHEMLDKPLTAMPFPSDDKYFIEDEP